MSSELSSEMTPRILFKQKLRDIDPTFRYYKSLFNITSDLIVVTDGDVILDANAAFINFFTHQNIDVFDPAFSFSNVFERIDKYGYVYDGYGMRRWFDTILRGSKQHWRVAIADLEQTHDFNITVQPIDLVEDAFVVTLTDITEVMDYRNVLEEGLRTSKKDKEETWLLLQQYDHAIDVANLVSKSDLNGSFTYVNEAFCNVLKYNREELVGENILIICPADQDDVCYEKVWETVEKGEIWKGVVENTDKEGLKHTFQATIVPIVDQAGSIIEYLSIRHEITEMVRAKEEAIRLLEAKSKFFDQVSHELRTPLNAIVNFTDQALENFEEMFEDEESRDLVKMYMERAYKNSQSLLYLINSLLDMAKLKSGKETFTIGEHDAVALIRETHENCSSLHKNTKVDYRLKITTSNVWIKCDPLKFRQVLTNLISNAFKFTKAGFVELSVEETAEEYWITVQDSGSGIPSDKLLTIFEPFEQSSNQDQGTGLGLSIVSEYCKGMGLKLQCESTLDEGTHFIVIAQKITPKEGSEWTI